MATKALAEQLTYKNARYFRWEGFTADTDVGGLTTAIAYVDLQDVAFIPSRWTVQAIRSAGATAVVDVALQGSMDGTNFMDLVTVTNTTTTQIVESDTAIFGVRYIRVYVTTVGLNNTLTVHAMGT